jgi:hypothetical protein
MIAAHFQSSVGTRHALSLRQCIANWQLLAFFCLFTSTRGIPVVVQKRAAIEIACFPSRSPVSAVVYFSAIIVKEVVSFQSSVFSVYVLPTKRMMLKRHIQPRAKG